MGANQRIVFTNNLQRCMKQRHVEQSDIVEALGISASTVSDWVNGKKYPRVDAMQRLADYLGVLLSDLTSEASEEEHTNSLNCEEQELLTIYRDLNDIGQQALMGTARGLYANPDMKKGWRVEHHGNIIRLVPVK